MIMKCGCRGLVSSTSAFLHTYSVFDLAAMCEKSDVDNLKLLEPFVIVCLGRLFTPGETINKGKVLSALDQDFALQAMPEAVLDKILLRIANKGSKIVKKIKKVEEPNGGLQFAYVNRPESLIAQFIAQEHQSAEDTEYK